MDQVRFYNSLTKKIADFLPKDKGKVRIYNCGPTVYKRQHLGNMRRFLFSDFLRRSLEYLGYEVRDITNITDVGHLTQADIDAGEDKLEKEAARRKKTPQEIAAEQTKLFFADRAALNIKPAHTYPRASRHIAQMQELIQKLLERRHAYQTASGVYFDVQSFPQYGRLSGNKLEDIIAGKRIEVRGEKKHPADFALWKTDDPKHLQQWDSPWGRGYPGWHIECSAMSLEYLGSDIDIHTGGEDNIFPHHENEIAQSEGATGEKFVRHWMHNRHLQLKGAKLAKSEGRQLTLDSLRERKFSPFAFRLLVFGTHYRNQLEFSWEALAVAAEHVAAVKQLLRQLLVHQTDDTGVIDEETILLFKRALASDLNTPKALAVFLQYVKNANKLLAKTPAPQPMASIAPTLASMDKVMGMVGSLENEARNETIPPEIRQLAEQREQARRESNFEAADSLRLKLEAKGFTIEDTASGPRIIKAA